MKKSLLILLLFPLLLKSQLLLKKKEAGYIWDKEGKKHSGIIKLKLSTSWGTGTSVRVIKGGKKSIKYDEHNMKSFVWGKDSFALIHKFFVPGLVMYESDFAEVVLSGEVNLFVHWRKVRNHSAGIYPNATSITTSDLVKTYVIQKKGSENYFGVFNKTKLEEHFIPMIEDDVMLKEEIQLMDKKNWMDSLEYFIEKYNRKKKGD